MEPGGCFMQQICHRDSGKFFKSIGSHEMNKKINKILACVDFSDYSLAVLEYALELAEAHTQILVYNVINQRDINMLESVCCYVPDKINAETYIKDMKKERVGKIRTMLKEHFFENKSQMNFKVDVGIPSEAILRTIETEAIDLVVMANKGRGNLARFLFGSSAEKVFRHSPVPVASVRESKKFKREK
jgi:nucleotide-binding universal stress UspA family protein